MPEATPTPGLGGCNTSQQIPFWLQLSKLRPAVATPRGMTGMKQLHPGLSCLKEGGAPPQGGGAAGTSVLGGCGPPSTVLHHQEAAGPEGNKQLSVPPEQGHPTENQGLT